MRDLLARHEKGLDDLATFCGSTDEAEMRWYEGSYMAGDLFRLAEWLGIEWIDVHKEVYEPARALTNGAELVDTAAIGKLPLVDAMRRSKEDPAFAAVLDYYWHMTRSGTQQDHYILGLSSVSAETEGDDAR